MAQTIDTKQIVKQYDDVYKEAVDQLQVCTWCIHDNRDGKHKLTLQCSKQPKNFWKVKSGWQVCEEKWSF